jgi:hypothetical protein
MDALVAEGLARREDDPADRRAVLLHVTPKGRRELARVQDAALGAIVRALEELDPPSRGALSAVLPKLTAALARTTRDTERVQTSPALPIPFTSSSRTERTVHATRRK